MLEIDNIYNMDCLEGMKQMADGAVDCVITSPPYNFNLRVHYDKYIKSSPFERNRIGGVNENKYGQTCTDDLSMEEYFDWQRQCIDEMLRVSTGLVFYNIQVLTGNKPAVFRLLGHYADRIKELIIWDKTMAEPAMYINTLNSAFELIIVLGHGNLKARSFDIFNAERGTVDNIFRIGKNQNRKSDISNKACFPLALPRKIVHLFTMEGQTILDPFMGSGTTAIACIKERRHFIGFEISKDYFNLANRNIDRHQRQLTLW